MRGERLSLKPIWLEVPHKLAFFKPVCQLLARMSAPARCRQKREYSIRMGRRVRPPNIFDEILLSDKFCMTQLNKWIEPLVRSWRGFPVRSNILLDVRLSRFMSGHRLVAVVILSFNTDCSIDFD